MQTPTRAGLALVMGLLIAMGACASPTIPASPLPSAPSPPLASSSPGGLPSVSPTVGPSSTVEPEPTIEAIPTDATAERDGMIVTLTLGAQRIVAGDALALTIRVRNDGPGVASFVGTDCQVVSAISIEGPRLPERAPGRTWDGDAGILKETTLSGDAPFGPALTRDQWEAGWLEGGCDSIGHVAQIDAGQTVTLDGIWPTITTFGEPVRGGQYRITLPLGYLGRERNPDLDQVPRPIEASGVVVIEPAAVPPGISPAQAIDTVLADPMFAAWLARLPLERWDGGDLRYGDGQWRFTLGFDTGEGEARVTLDAISGLVIERQLP
jgi:hypothetical protein